MKRKLLTSMLALWTLAFTSPAFAFVCQLPCKMTQKQMMDCAKSCSAKKPAQSIGKGDCVRLQISATPVFTGLDALDQQAPVLAIAVESQPLFLAGSLGLAGGQPLRGPPCNSLAEFPSAHAPPTLI